MPKKKTIRVRAAAGLSLPIPSRTAIDTGLRVFSPETPVEVIYNHFIRKRLRAGDLVEVTEGKPAERRGAPAPLPLPPLPGSFDEGGE